MQMRDADAGQAKRKEQDEDVKCNSMLDGAGIVEPKSDETASKIGRREPERWCCMETMRKPDLHLQSSPHHCCPEPQAPYRFINAQPPQYFSQILHADVSILTGILFHIVS